MNHKLSSFQLATLSQNQLRVWCYREHPSGKNLRPLPTLKAQLGRDSFCFPRPPCESNDFRMAPLGTSGSALNFWSAHCFRRYINVSNMLTPKIQIGSSIHSPQSLVDIRWMKFIEMHFSNASFTAPDSSMQIIKCVSHLHSTNSHSTKTTWKTLKNQKGFPGKIIRPSN